MARASWQLPDYVQAVASSAAARRRRVVFGGAVRQCLTLRSEVVRQELVESHPVGRLDREPAAPAIRAPRRRTPPGAARSAGTDPGNTPCAGVTCAARMSANDSPVDAQLLQRPRRRREPRVVDLALLADRARRCTAAARRRRRAARRFRASNRSVPAPMRATLSGARCGSVAVRARDRDARRARGWRRAASCSVAPIGSLCFSTHSAANASRKRSLF